ncbi:MAG: 3-hydroxyisobutyrate dehydrogenase [Porticoccaceae bacterium]|nr:3-hydroxyisobutyrate dehydrogenase [Pseudomonadales bacterium]MCP5170701.1 3-hydroxyisobutyrate dehydrogenase [Pseudomonadales bacterium]MCP5302058.1 3-hydroxyisobutyrate dehydrogenase [Pseudomonadales bacterium]
MAQKVAFVGLGNMGGGMAINLVKAGFEVHAFDLSPAALQHAVDGGCHAASTAVEAIDGADFIITMLPNGHIVESVMIDNDKLLDHVGSSALIIDCSTVAPQNSRRVAEEAQKRGLKFVDAPVSGGVAAAAAGTLAFMCGGPVEDVEQAKTVLSAMGNNVFRAGDHGAGSVAKICNNMLLAIHMAGTAEALQLGIDNGLDPAALSEIMLKSSGCNWSLEKYNPCPGVMDGVPSSNNYQGGFMVKLMQKDLGLAQQAASGSGSYTPMGQLAADLYAEHSQGSQVDGRNNADIDFASIMQLFASKK